VRKLLVAVCVVSGFALATDAAWARMRISVPSKPVAVKSPQQKSTTAAKTQGRSAPPRTWIVPIPRVSSQASAAPAAAADFGDAAAFGDLAAVRGANEAAPQPAKAMPEPQAPGRVVVLNPATPQQPKPKQVAARSHQPYDVTICYWNRTGQCVR
jgi:hypothetical protein